MGVDLGMKNKSFCLIFRILFYKFRRYILYLFINVIVLKIEYNKFLMFFVEFMYDFNFLGDY